MSSIANPTLSNTAPRPADAARPTRRTVAVAGALLAAAPAFGLALLAGSADASLDAGLAPIVRFMGGTKLALAFLVAGLSIARYARPERRRRLVAGLVAAVLMAFGAGLIWSGGGFGAGFAAFASGLAVTALLVMKELEASLKRRP